MRSDLSPFLNWSIEITFIVLLVSILIAFVRLVRGPSLPDRIVALDLLTLLAVGVIALFAIREDKPVFLDAAIALAEAGRIEILRKGKPVPPEAVRGEWLPP